jgi:hypothetical protein
VSQLSRKCGILDVSQPYWPSGPVTGSLYLLPHVLVDNIKMNVRETGWSAKDWIYLAQDRDQCWILVNIIMNLWVS